MKIYLATWLFEESQGNCLTKLNSSNRLLSYFFIKQQGISLTQFQTYVRTGMLRLVKDKRK